MSKRLGLDLWIKRDDLTGFAMGGNKARKLEYILPEIVAARADVVVCCGASHSNFVRQLGAACGIHGVRCVAVVMDLPHPPGRKPATPPPPDETGNLLLDRILGVEIQRIPDGTWEDLFAATELRAQAERDAGKRVYEVPVGGSSAVGAYGFFEAGRELIAQSYEPFDFVVVPTSSGSTHVGLGYGLLGQRTHVVGISCDNEPDHKAELVAISEGLAQMLGRPTPLGRDEWDLREGYAGPGYGVPSPEGESANILLARNEGIFLDPIYTAKAFAGLLDLAARGEVFGRVLFWHTGGMPSVFAGWAGVAPSGESGR
jgi:D-cysteine desulfhydrase/L-cysteate sulfo-lyase